MNKKGRLMIISGPSGSGKGTVVNKLIEKGGYMVSISATTRQPRENEVDGVNYYFKSKNEFEEIIGEDGFLEYACYNGNYYGTPKKAVFDKLETGVNVILEIEVQGALKIKEAYPDTLMIMIAPPTYSNLERRLRDRGDTKEEDIVKRLSIARKELGELSSYSHLVVNYDGRLAETVDTICRIVDGEEISECLTENNGDFIKKFYMQ